MATYPLALLKAAGEGDRDAICGLVAAAQGDARRFARRTCRSSSDVDDAVQETLFILSRKVGALGAIGSLSAWLYVVVRRECLRLARMFGRPAIGIDEIADDVRFAAAPPSGLRLDLVDALQSLPPHYRSVVLLRDFDELSIDEIATTLALSRETVKARLNRARTLLREYLRA